MSHGRTAALGRSLSTPGLVESKGRIPLERMQLPPLTGHRIQASSVCEHDKEVSSNIIIRYIVTVLCFHFSPPRPATSASSAGDGRSVCDARILLQSTTMAGIEDGSGPRGIEKNSTLHNRTKSMSIDAESNAIAAVG